MRFIDRKYFGNANGRLNSDDAGFAIQPNEWINAENVRTGTTDKGVIGTVESIGSTRLLSTPQPSVNFIQIGSAIDEANNRFCYFMYNTTGVEHKILCWSEADQFLYTVLLASQVTGGLNFDKNYVIHSARVINGVLYWTNNLGDPCRVNIDAGIKLNHSSFVTEEEAYTSPMNPQVITVARKPPNYPLSFVKTTSGAVGITVNNNQINGFSGRFAWFYSFRGGEMSTLSMHSKLVPYNTEAETYDVVTITASLSEQIDQDVKSVTIAVIYADGEQGFEVKTWYKDNADDLVEIQNHNAGITPLTFQFTNSEIGAAIDSATLVKPFDVIPLRSKSLERATNRLFLCNNLLGYDTPKLTSLTATTLTSSTSPTAIKTGSSRRIGIVFFDKYMRQCGVLPYSELITVADKTFSLPTNYVYAVQWGLSNANAVNEIPDWAYYYAVVSTKDITRNFFVQAFAGDIFYASRDSEGTYAFENTAYSVDNVGVALRLNTLSGQGMGYSFSAGDLVNVRVSTDSVTTSATLSVKETSGDYLIVDNFDLGTLNYTSIAVFEIYTPNNKAASNFYYEQGSIYSILSPTQTTRQYSTLAGVIEGDVYVLEKDTLNKIGYDIPTDYIASETLFTLGVDFVSQFASSTEYSTGSSPLQSTSGFNPDTDNTRWILETNTNPVTFNIRGSLEFATLLDDTFKAWIEYNDGTDSTEFLLVPFQDTENGQAYTKTFNIDVTVPANCRVFILGAVTTGGVTGITAFRATTMVVTTMADGTQTKFECMSPNDKYWQNWFTNAGRVQIEDRIGQQHLKTSIRWSNTFIAGTSINGLSSFEALNQKILQPEMGEVNKIILANKIDEQGQGNVMLAICTSQTASMYLGETQLMASSKTSDVTTIDSVIGGVNVLKGSYGTINPESVTEYRGNVFWFDATNGRAIQYSANGLFAISNYKMTRFWKLFSDLYMSLTSSQIEALGGRPFIFTSVDPHHNELLFSIPKLSSTPPKGYLPDYPSTVYPFDIWDAQGKTIVYKLDLGLGNPHFQGSYSFNPEGFISLNDNLYSFRNGHLYIHNQTTSYNEFYGTQYKSKIMFVSNQEPTTPKVFDAVEVQANMTPTLSYFYNDYPYLQASDLMDFDYRTIEGKFYAAMYRNKLVPTAEGFSTNGLLTAEKLRARVLMVMLEFTVSDEPLELEFVEIKFSLSRGHNQLK